jgi:hypothetical protein
VISAEAEASETMPCGISADPYRVGADRLVSERVCYSLTCIEVAASSMSLAVSFG